MTGWSHSTARQQFSEADDNLDMSIVDTENQSALHWVRRWLYLTKLGCPNMIAYDVVATRARKSRRTIQSFVRAYQYFGDDLEEYMRCGISYLTAAVTRKDPEGFMDAALRSPGTTLDTLLAEYPPADGIDAPPAPEPPYHRVLWGMGRILPSLPQEDKVEAEKYLAKLDEILKRNGVE